jgi:small GTP-binding protein
MMNTAKDTTLAIAILGHVDHGKSTLIGRLLYDTKTLSEEKIDEIRKASSEQGKEMEFAFLIDAFKEERDKGMTIDTAQLFFKTPERTYVIIDAPGHKEFIKNMITGTSQAEAALVLVDATEGIKDQTRRHCWILGMLGIKQVACVINKMDMVNYSKQEFENLVAEVKQLFVQNQLNAPLYIIPISALKGDNVTLLSKNMAWYTGPALLEILGSFKGKEIEARPFRFPVQDIYEVDGKRIIVGRVESGSVSKGEDLSLFPGNRAVKVKSIERFLCQDLKKANYQECIGLCLDNGQDIKRGDILAKEPLPYLMDSLRANIFWMEDIPYNLNDPLVFKTTTQEVACKIERIFVKYDPASMEEKQEDANRINGAEVAQVLIRLEEKVAVDSFDFIPEMGRFVLEKDRIPVAGGIIGSIQD